ncbi:MAG: uridine kinase, partial [Rhodothermales bacterium]|nr:uridine kinase [Rhodothermales bacterium]
MRKSVVIGIAGGSGSGKSTVLSSIIRSLGRRQIAVLDHDSYYRDLTHLDADERSAFNFDHPAALETNLLCQHLDVLQRGFAVDKPTYDFEAHNRRTETETVEPRRVILVEGILVLTNAELARRMDIKVFVDADPDVRLMRRIRRDITERGRSIDSVLLQYESTVRPMHLEFVEPSKRVADIIIPRGGHNTVAVDLILAQISALLDEPRQTVSV